MYNKWRQLTDFYIVFDIWFSSGHRIIIIKIFIHICPYIEEMTKVQMRLQGAGAPRSQKQTLSASGTSSSLGLDFLKGTPWCECGC